LIAGSKAYQFGN